MFSLYHSVSKLMPKRIKKTAYAVYYFLLELNIRVIENNSKFLFVAGIAKKSKPSRPREYCSPPHEGHNRAIHNRHEGSRVYYHQNYGNYRKTHEAG